MAEAEDRPGGRARPHPPGSWVASARRGLRRLHGRRPPSAGAGPVPAPRRRQTWALAAALSVGVAAAAWWHVRSEVPAGAAFCGPPVGAGRPERARPRRGGCEAQTAFVEADEEVQPDPPGAAANAPDLRELNILAANENKGPEKEPTGQERQERQRAIAIALLQSMGQVEDLIESGQVPMGSDRSLQEHHFVSLLDQLQLQVEAQDSRDIFRALAPDGSLKADSLRECVRESPLIKELYSDGLSQVAFTVLLTFAFAAGLVAVKGVSSGLDFLTGYVVEDSLSVDNLFVFLALFKYFKVPPGLQSYCLNLGIYGAVLLRAGFIFAGLAAVKSFRPLLIIFSGLLLYASYRTLTGNEDEEDEGPPAPIMELLGKFPTTPEFDGEKLFVPGKSGQWLATPLALCIIAVELSDILFAVDSIPAVFAVTDDPLIVYTSNIAAIIGLRSLYQVLAVAATDLIYLEKAVAVILGFVGLKLGGEVAGFEVGSAISLGVIVSVLGIGIALSLTAPKRGTQAKAVDAV